MIFNSPTVQKYILSGAKVVATIRKAGYYKLGQRVAMKVGDRKFYGRVIAVSPLTPFSLDRYVDYSGFENIEVWISEAERLHKAKIDPNKFEIVVVKVVHEWSPIHNGVCKKLRVESSDNKIEIRKIEEVKQG